MINYLNVNIVKSSWSDGTVTLRTITEIDGIERCVQAEIPLDDLKSRFDQIWEYAKKETLKLIEEYESWKSSGDMMHWRNK
jgi:hypothetical protein